jgi:hypothetical protein
VENVLALSVDPSRPARLQLATEQGLWLSDDEGGEWRRAVVPAGQGDQAVYSIARDPTKQDRLWAAAERNLLRSEDGGSSWSSVEIEGLGAKAVLAFGPGERTPRIYAGGANGLHATSDGGGFWDGDGAGLEGAVLALAVAQDGAVLVGTSVGVFERDADEHEFRAARGLPRGAARAVAFAPDGALAAVSSTLYRRTSGWRRVEMLPLAVNGDPPGIGAILRLADGRLLLGTEHGLHSSDAWKLVPPFDQMTYLEIGALAGDPGKPQRVYLGASSVPNAVALSRIGITFNAATTETGDERFAVVIGVLFLVGAVLGVRYLSRKPPTDAATTPAEPE